MFGDNSNGNANGQQAPVGSDLPAINPPADNSATDAAAASADLSQPAVAAPAAQDSAQADVANFGGDAPADASASGDEQATDATPAPGNEELLDIKQQALQQLTPLVDHLDQSPREEFRTTMMMIQATDNQNLIKKAFEAAQKIQDDKDRAQAFLDIINEINYFTQHPSDQQ